MGSTLNLCYNEIACLSMKGPSTRGFNVYFIFYLALQIRSFTLKDWINFNFNQTFKIYNSTNYKVEKKPAF